MAKMLIISHVISFSRFFYIYYYQIVKIWIKVLSALLFGGFFHKLFYWRDCRSVATKEKIRNIVEQSNIVPPLL